jgi:Protein of unknown function (DUF2934)
MAKRKQTPSQANDSGASTPAKPKTRKSRAAIGPEPDTIGSYPGVEGIEESPNPALTTADEASGSMSMSSEPSEDDIRMRAYQRYLERGGGHGLEFDDWLEAERELKPRR